MDTNIYQTLPRIKLLDRTPMTRLDRLGQALGNLNLYIKRDDIGATGGGGNKLRKLEFILARALAEGCDTLITFGALQSNHARLTAAVAARFGLKCHLILNRKVPRTGPHYEGGGNLVLDSLFGAKLHVLSADDDPLAYCERVKTDLGQRGAKPYVVPFGGSDALGAIGYVSCIQEIMEQAKEENIAIDHLVHASGSGGTQAGLELGARMHGAAFDIQGVSVLHPAAVLEPTVNKIINDAVALLGGAPNADTTQLHVDDRFVGRGYGLIDKRVSDTLALVASTEGILLDPVYTGKAFSGLVERVREGRYKENSTVVFVHTGGLPGLFAYSDELLDSGSLGPAL